MITGFNVEIDHDGKRYHIQTEDRGRKEAVIETLVYIGGKILHSERTLYKDIAEACEDKEIAALMEMQHRRMLRAIRSGKYDDAPRKRFGDDLLSAKSLDEVVLDFLGQGMEETLELTLRGDAPLAPGGVCAIRVQARTSRSKQPVAGAEITATVEYSDDKSRELARAVTGADGLASIRVEVPKDVDRESSIVVLGASDLGSDRVRQMVVLPRT